MKLTTQHPTQHRVRHSGGISVGTLLMVCVVVLLAALGTVGFLLYQSHSGKMEAESKRLAAEQALAEEKARTTKAEADKAKQERENRLAIAQSLRDSFAARAGVATNILHGLLDRIPLVEQEMNDFRKGSKGIPVTTSPELVQTAMTFFTSEMNFPKRSIAVSHLEGVRLILIRNNESRGTEAQPSPEAEALVAEARVWGDNADTELNKVSAFIRSTLNQASSKVQSSAKPAASLDDAIETARTDAALKIATEKAAAQKRADELVRQRSNENTVNAGIIRARELEEENARRQREAEAAIAKQKLIEEARSAAIQNLLAPFITPGRVDIYGGLLSEKGPLSWKQLSAVLEKDRGAEQLYRLTTSNYDKDRPRLPRVDLRKDSQTYDRVVEMRRALQRLGPILVELKMLNP